MVTVYSGGGEVMRFIGQPIVTVLILAVPIGLYIGIVKLIKVLSNRKKGEEVTAQADETPLEQS
jgi:uncharacterized membrane protein (DUF106 family)